MTDEERFELYDEWKHLLFLRSKFEEKIQEQENLLQEDIPEEEKEIVRAKIESFREEIEDIDNKINEIRKRL